MRPSKGRLPSLRTGQEFAFASKRKESLPRHAAAAAPLPRVLNNIPKDYAGTQQPYSTLKYTGIQPALDHEAEAFVSNIDDRHQRNPSSAQKGNGYGHIHTTSQFRDVPKERSSTESSEEGQRTTWGQPKRKRRNMNVREEDEIEEVLPCSIVTGRHKFESDKQSNQRPAFDQYLNGPVRPSALHRDVDQGVQPHRQESAAFEGFLSTSKKGIRSSFVPPARLNEGHFGRGGEACQGGAAMAAASSYGKDKTSCESSKKICAMLNLDPDCDLPEKLRNVDSRMVEHICNEVMNQDSMVKWEDIAGLENAKSRLKEMVIYPLLRPDLFQGTRAPGRGLLLFGPPGTGKTLIGKAIAGEAEAVFFSISASSLTSKWIGEGEKLVRTLFAVASCLQPAVIFIDEIDSLLSQRKDEGEHESSRRLKTQFLIEMEGCTGGDDQVLLVGATNRPQELDSAVRRRLCHRLLIPLPEAVARVQIVENLLKKDGLFTLSADDMDVIARDTEGYSGSDMKSLVSEASMEPLREVMKTRGVRGVKKEEIRDICLKDFRHAIRVVKPSVAPSELGVYMEWSAQFGTGDLG